MGMISPCKSTLHFKLPAFVLPCPLWVTYEPELHFVATKNFPAMAGCIPTTPVAAHSLYDIVDLNFLLGVGWSCFMDGNRQMPNIGQEFFFFFFYRGRLFVIHNADYMHNVVQTRPDEAHCIVNILPWFGCWSVKRLSVYAFRVNALYLCIMIDNKCERVHMSMQCLLLSWEEFRWTITVCFLTGFAVTSCIARYKRVHFMWTVFFLYNNTRAETAFSAFWVSPVFIVTTEPLDRNIQQGKGSTFFLQKAYCRCYTNV